MSSVFLKILNMSITAGWLILAVFLSRLLLRRAPKWIVCILWALVGIRLILPFSIGSPLSLIPSTETVPKGISLQTKPALDTGIPVIDRAVNPVISKTFAADPYASVNPLQILIPILTAVWIAGILAMLFFALLSYLKLRRTVSSGVPSEDGVMLVDEIPSPFILGILRPVICIPSSMDGEALSHVLLHEKAHLRRRDHWWKPLGYLLLSVYWFNPLCWIAYLFLCRDIEMACDEKVIRDMNREGIAAYSQSLLNLSVHRRNISACPLAFGETGVKQRIRGILSYRKPAFWIILIAVILCIVLAVCLLTDPSSSSGLSDRLAVSMDMAVADHHRSSQPQGEFAAVDYDVLKVSESTGVTTVYAWVLYEEYGYNGQEPVLVTASRVPSKISFDTSSEGGDSSAYPVLQYWEPRDGTYFEGDIRAEFPENIQKKALDVSGAEKQHEKCLASALEYFRENPGKGSPQNPVICTATVTKVADREMLVKPLEGSDELRTSDSFSVMLTYLAPEIPKAGDLVEIAYDGYIRTIYPSEFGTIYSVKIIGDSGETSPKTVKTDGGTAVKSPGSSPASVAAFSDAGLPELVSVTIKPLNPPSYGISFIIPEGWYFEAVQTDDIPTGTLSVIIRPTESADFGQLLLQYSKGFGVCGTGLRTEETEFNGHPAIRGYFDGKELWDYILLRDPEDCVIINEIDGWYADYENEIEAILGSVEFVRYGE